MFGGGMDPDYVAYATQQHGATASTGRCRRDMPRSACLCAIGCGTDTWTQQTDMDPTPPAVHPCTARQEYDVALDDALASLYDNVHMKAELAVVKDRMVGGAPAAGGGGRVVVVVPLLLLLAGSLSLLLLLPHVPAPFA